MTTPSPPPLRWSFRSKVAAVAWITTVTALVVAFGVVVAQQWTQQKARLVQERTTLGLVLAENLSASLVFEDRPGAQTILRAIGQVPSVRGAVLFDGAGRVFVQAGQAPPAAQAQGATRPTARFVAERLEVRVPVFVEHERVGELMLDCGLDQFHAWLRSYSLIAGLAFALATAIAVLVGLWLATIIIRPVSRLARAMDTVRQSGEFGPEVARTSHDEVGQLTDAFNSLLGELKRNDRSLHEALDELTRARDHADTANLQKSQFLAHMSHEIRTPLNGVLGMVQAMRQHPLSHDQAERLSVVYGSGEILLSILNDILDVSKIEAGKLELEQAPFDIVAVAQRVRAIFGPTAETKTLAFTLDIAPEAEGGWRGDATRIQQILSNLVSNALKFTEQGGVHLRIDVADGALRLSVQDSGPGISPEHQARLFDAFQQADASTTRRYGGTGLGLSICRDLSQLMGGQIRVESQLGVGARFAVCLPLERAVLAPPPSTATARDLAAAAAERPLRILGVDDNATNRLVLQALLGPLGADLTLAADGAAAIALWSASAYDVVLMDIQMPGMDGVETTRRIRAQEAAERRVRTPILALSANAMSHQVADYLAAGMDGHIAKPIETVRLYQALAAIDPLGEPA